uniref:Neprosin PEP catalytic domain-containing protein n=1 Tax=Quercus lobata TaxID=97700 RepID=A0A7N2LE89_QUELO
MALPCGSERRWSRAVKMTFYCLFFLIPMSSAGNRNTNTIFGKKQKLEVQQQLKRLNKPALKSIESPDGDIIDCVDIYKQPAFDHPLLKNHTIQMRPSSYPEGFSFDEINGVSSNSEPEFTQPWHLNGRCPEGTIPIRRTKEEDLLRAGSIANFGRKKYHTNPHTQSNVDPNIHENATYSETWDQYYGMTADMNIWNPYTQEDNDSSSYQFWVMKGEYGQDLDSIEAGAMDDAYQSTGCYNLLCPGFVHVDKEIALGAIVTPYSKYGGNQYALKFYVWKDVYGGGDWWMNINHRSFGYWPSSIFSILTDSGSRVSWGGEVINYNSGGQHTTTQMGSGHFAEEGPGKASFFKNLNVIDGKLSKRAPRDPVIFMTKPNCYSIKDYGGFFYFGGPGRNPNCP